MSAGAGRVLAGMAVPPGCDFGPEVAAQVAARLAADEAEEVAHISRKTGEWLAARRRRRIGIDPEAPGPEPKLSAKLLAEMAETPGRGAYIHGDVGRGKTYLAEAMQRAWDGEGRTYCARDPLFFTMLKSCYDGRGDATRVMDMALSAGFLVFDDVGKSKPTDWTVQTIFEIADWRVSMGRPTVWTSNYRLDELRARLSGPGGEYAKNAEAICSRIKGSCLDCPMAGPDRRLAR